MAQKPVADFRQVDDFVKTVKYNDDLIALTHTLTSPYPQQLFKARAIFKWITENIAYDYKYYNQYALDGKEQPGFDCKASKDCERLYAQWENDFLKKLLEKKKAVCAGYASLFKKMCSLAGLSAEIIPGYVRTEIFQIGTPGRLDHAWNAVKIDSAFYLLDVTWAAGFCYKNDDGKLQGFKKNYNDYYWLTPASELARNHYPKNAQWLMLNNYSKEKFAENPYYAGSHIHRIKLIEPLSGILSAKKGDTLRFGIEYDTIVKHLQINSNTFRNPPILTVVKEKGNTKYVELDTFALKKQRYIPFLRMDNLMLFEYIVTDNSLYYLDILFDRQRVLRFKVNTSQK